MASNGSRRTDSREDSHSNKKNSGFLKNFVSPGEKLFKSNCAVQAHAAGHAILVNQRVQRGNPLLKYIENVPIQYDEDILPDYVIGESCCALFLSLRYHLLHPSYLLSRLDSIGREFRTRILLCLVDVEDNAIPLVEINAMAAKHEFTLLLAWTWKEAARYLETCKCYEKKPPTIIQERLEVEHSARLADIITTVRAVNKTDASTLATTFGSLQNIFTASVEALALCPGLGEKKVQNLYENFNTPFPL